MPYLAHLGQMLEKEGRFAVGIFSKYTWLGLSQSTHDQIACIFSFSVLSEHSRKLFVNFTNTHILGKTARKIWGICKGYELCIHFVSWLFCSWWSCMQNNFSVTYILTVILIVQLHQLFLIGIYFQVSLHVLVDMQCVKSIYCIRSHWGTI